MSQWALITLREGEPSREAEKIVASKPQRFDELLGAAKKEKERERGGEK
jgi:hypothetical protein